MFLNLYYNPVHIFIDIVIPEAEHGVAKILEVLCSRGIISSVFFMLPPVDFDNQFFLGTTEVRNIWTYGMLSPKSVAERFSSESRPKDRFLRSLVCSKCLSETYCG